MKQITRKLNSKKSVKKRIKQKGGNAFDSSTLVATIAPYFYGLMPQKIGFYNIKEWIDLLTSKMTSQIANSQMKNVQDTIHTINFTDTSTIEKTEIGFTLVPSIIDNFINIFFPYEVDKKGGTNVFNIQKKLFIGTLDKSFKNYDTSMIFSLIKKKYNYNGNIKHFFDSKHIKYSLFYQIYCLQDMGELYILYIKTFDIPELYN